MSLNYDQFVERVFSQLPGTPQPTVRDDIGTVQFDACSALGEMISDSPLKGILTRDFVAPCVGGFVDLNATTLVGGAALSTVGINNVVWDTIPRHKAIHPDSLESLQWERTVLAVDKPKRDATFGYLYAAVTAAGIYIRTADALIPSDQNVTYRSSFSPLLSFFAGTSPIYQELENTLISIAARLVMGGVPQAQAS